VVIVFQQQLLPLGEASRLAESTVSFLVNRPASPKQLQV